MSYVHKYLATIFLLFLTTTAQGQSATFSTVAGGSSEDQSRDAAVDSAGNVYVCGGAASPSFPTTPGAYDTTQNGSMDAFVAKFSPTGTLIWSTFIGGPNYDRAYALEVDAAGDVYVTGRAGRNFPTTNGFDHTFGGYNVPVYGEQNAFVCKIQPDGSNISWCSYEGPFEMNRDIAIDNDGDVYVASNYDPADGGEQLDAAWFAGEFQSTPQGSKDGVVIKMHGDGSGIIWATLLGGSAFDSGTPSIRVDANKNPYVLLFTNSANIPTTRGAYDTTYNGRDLYLAKLTVDGRDLVYATYVGGSGTEFSETHGLAVDSLGQAYVGGTTESTDLPTTVGAYDTSYNGSGGPGTGNDTNYNGDGFVAKFGSRGDILLACTYLGGSLGDGLEGIALDAAGNVYVGGGTYSTNFPTTPGAYDISQNGLADMFLSKLDSTLSVLLYGTFVGGSDIDYGRGVAASGGRFYLLGLSYSSNFPSVNSRQSGNSGNGDATLTGFVSHSSIQIGGKANRLVSGKNK